METDNSSAQHSRQPANAQAEHLQLPAVADSKAARIPDACAHETRESPSPQTDATLLVSLHDGHRNKTPSDLFGKIEASSTWRPVSITPLELIEHISAGKAWVGCHLSGGRSEANAGASNLIALDIDGDLSLEDFWAKPPVARCCLFTATSCSHTAESNRFRAVFRCDEHDEPRLHKAIYHQWLAVLDLKLKDNGGEKPERLWFGNDAAKIQLGAGEPISWDIVEAAKEALAADLAKRTAPRPEASASDVALDNERAARALEQLLRPSSDGEFNSYWSSVFNAAAATGSELVREAFFCWHSKGHHSKTQKGVEKRFDRAGTKISPGQGAGQLLKFAKEQHGEQWWKQMPEELQYGKGGTTPNPPISLMRARSAEDIEPPQNLSGWNGGTSYKPPISLASSRSLADTLTPPDFGGPMPFSDAAANSATCAVPDVVPTSERLKQYAESAPPTVLFSSKRKAGDTTPSAPAPSISESIHIEKLLCQLYSLETERIEITADGEKKISQRAARYRIDQLESELLNYQVFRSNPQRIHSRLLQIFSDINGITERDSGELTDEPPLLDDDIDNTWLIEGLMVNGASYLLYSLAGAGKTTFALLLARTALGAPGADNLLGYKTTPPRPFSQSRVLYIASDSKLFARGDINKYLRAMKQQGQEWVQYMRVLAAKRNNKAAPWRFDLQGFHKLVERLDFYEEAGTPVSMVIVDSLKACMPERLLVGDQAVTKILAIMEEICERRNVTLVYLHHQSKESDQPQGVAGLTEMVHGYFRIKLEDSQRYFCVMKTRDGQGERREIHYNVSSTGVLLQTSAIVETVADSPESILLKVFGDHHAKHVLKVSHLHKDDPDRNYRGIQRSEIPLHISRSGMSHPSLRATRTLEYHLKRAINNGKLKRLERGFYAIAHSMQINPQRDLGLTEAATAASETDNDFETPGLPGWDF